MAVHDIDVDPVGARRFGRGHLLSQPRKIGRQNGRSNPDRCSIHCVLPVMHPLASTGSVQGSVLHLSGRERAPPCFPEHGRLRGVLLLIRRLGTAATTLVNGSPIRIAHSPDIANTLSQLTLRIYPFTVRITERAEE